MAVVGRGPNPDDEILTFQRDSDADESATSTLYSFLFDIIDKYEISVTNNSPRPGVRHAADFCADVRRAVIAAGFIEPVSQVDEEAPIPEIKAVLDQAYGRSRFADNYASQIVETMVELGWRPTVAPCTPIESEPQTPIL
jgi:hypothetical protein